MKKSHNQRLVLGCIVLATELVRLAHELIALLNTAINYSLYHEAEVGFAV